MNTVIFQTDNAVFKFAQKEVRDYLIGKKTEDALDEVSQLLKLISTDNDETILTLTGDTGLTLYASTPNKLRHRLIGAFKRNPKAFIGITKTHLIMHTIKALVKYRLVAVVMPFIVLALILSFLPICLVWTVFVVSSGYLVISVARKFKPKKKGE